MKNKVILASVALLLCLLSSQAKACELEKILKGTHILSTVYDKKQHHEKALIKELDNKHSLGGVVGEIVAMKLGYWEIKNAHNQTVGSMDGHLVFMDKNDVCQKDVIKLEHRTNDHYFVIKNTLLIGDISGRLPRM